MSKRLDANQVRRPLGRLKIVPELCIGDGLCIDGCPVGILEWSKKPNAKGYLYPVIKAGREEECTACNYCGNVCPRNAIYVEREEYVDLTKPAPRPVVEYDRVLIIGGGIAGIEAALALARMGRKVTLVEKSPSIGGKMAQLDKTFPTLDCSICIEGPLMSEVSGLKNVEILTSSEVLEVSGEPGRYRAKILVKPRFVTDECTRCGLCTGVCPMVAPDEYNAGLSTRKAIYQPFTQAVPGIYVIDPDICLNKPPDNIVCNRCTEVCEPRSIVFTMTPRIVERGVSSIIVATGYELEGGEALKKLGYGSHPNVLTSLEFERLVNSAGPTMGEIIKPADRGHPRKLLLVSCVGSRNEKYNSYCSKVCCEYLLKQAIYAKNHGVEDVTLLYMNDIRTYGKLFDNLYRKVVEEGVRIIHGRPQIIGYNNGGIRVRLEDTRTGKTDIEEFDMVVLAPALKPPSDLRKLSVLLGMQLDKYGFVSTNPANPVATSQPGIFAIGAATGPRDITESVVMAWAAATQAALMTKPTKSLEESVTELAVGEEGRVGVFVCHCGSNIAGVADVNELVRFSQGLPNVVHAESIPFACSKPGLERVGQVIREKGLNRVVIAACSPATHLPIFRDVARKVGLNPYLVTMVNIRNLDTWVHPDRRVATEKAKDMIKMGVAEALRLRPVRQLRIPIINRALIIGCGPAGLAAATALAESGVETIVVERGDKCGGLVAQSLIKALPEGETAYEALNNLIKRALRAGVRVIFNTTVREVSGFAGNFHVVLTNNEELDVGTIIVTTGANPITTKELGLDDSRAISIYDALTGPPRELGNDVVILDLCGKPYCQSVMLNLAIRYVKEGRNVYVVYRDMMTVGQLEDIYREARRSGVYFLRIPRDGSWSTHVTINGDSMIVNDVELGGPVTVRFTSILVNTPMKPNTEDISKILKLAKYDDGHFVEAHVKLGPVDTMTPGVFIAGAARSDVGLGEAITEGFAAAGKALALLSTGQIVKDSLIPRVDPNKCVGCMMCVKACPFNAIEGKPGHVIKINEAACQGCGACVGECPYGALDMDWPSDDAILAQVEAALAEEPEKKVVMFTCAYCSYWAADNAGIFKLQYPPYARIIRLQCSSRLSWKHVKRAFELGAAGVFVTGCRLGDCHFITANYNTVRRFENWRKRLKNIGVREERFQMRLFGAPDVTDLVEAMREAERVVKTVTKEEIEQTKQKIKQLR